MRKLTENGKAVTVEKFLEEYSSQYRVLCDRTDERWKSAAVWGDYWLRSDTKVGNFLRQCAEARGDYFSSDKEVAAVFYTLTAIH